MSICEYCGEECDDVGGYGVVVCSVCSGQDLICRVCSGTGRHPGESLDKPAYFACLTCEGTGGPPVRETS